MRAVAQVISKPGQLTQSDLTSLVSWSIFSRLLFNQIKCKHQRITRKINPVLNTYTINGIDQEICDSERDLGVWVTCDLTWNKQVTEQRTKANKLGFVRRASRNIRNTETRCTLYLAIVRSHLGHASQLWTPQSIELLKKWKMGNGELQSTS